MPIASLLITSIPTQPIHTPPFRQKWDSTTQIIQVLTIVDMRTPSGAGLTMLAEGATHSGMFSSSSRFCLIVRGCPGSWLDQPERGVMHFGKWGGLCDSISLVIPNLKIRDFLQITYDTYDNSDHSRWTDHVDRAIFIPPCTENGRNGQTYRWTMKHCTRPYDYNNSQVH